MDNDMMVPMLNRGAVRWVPTSQIQERLKMGWERWELQESPKESYYPQYDRLKDVRKDDDRIPVLGSEDEIGEILGLIAL